MTPLEDKIKKITEYYNCGEYVCGEYECKGDVDKKIKDVVRWTLEQVRPDKEYMNKIISSDFYTRLLDDYIIDKASSLGIELSTNSSEE